MTDDNISRHELKIKHRRLQEKAKHIKALYEDTRRMLQEFHDSYIQLYEYFPLLRYPKLKRLIKETASKETLDELGQRVRESGQVGEEDQDSDSQQTETEDGQVRPLVAGGKPYGVAKQVLRKITKFCGLDSDPIEDEDVMNDAELWKHIHRREREISFHHTEMAKTLVAMETLHSKYVRSKTSVFPVRLFRLKRIVRELIAATKPDSKYEK